MPTDPRMLAMTARAVPALPADAQVAINSQGLDTQGAMDQAQGTQAYADATAQVNYMKERDQDEQVSMWQNADDAKRAQWVGAGYNPPASQSTKRGLLSRIGHDILGAPAAVYRQAEAVPVLGDVVDGIGNVGDAVSEAAGAGGRAVQHLYRTGEMMNIDQGNSNNIGTNILAGIGGAAMDAGAWADAWHETTRGDQTFNPVKDRDIQAGSGLDDNEIGLAKAMAGSQKDVQNYMQMKQNAGMSTQDLTTLAARMDSSDPDNAAFADVVQQYKDAKLSFGRSLVPSYLWSHDHVVAEALSGIGDLAFSFVDPLIIGGKINKVARFSKYAFGSLEEFEAKLGSSGFQEYAKSVARYTAEGDAPGLARAHPELNDVNSWLIQHRPQNADEFTTLAKGDKENRAAQQAAVSGAEAAQTEAQNALAQAQIAHDAVKETGVKKDIRAARNSVRTSQYNLDILSRKTEAAVQDFVTNNALALHLSGGGGLTISGAPALPSLNAVGKVAMQAKLTTGDAIDWLRKFDIPAGPNGLTSAAGSLIEKPFNTVGDLLHKAVTLAPTHGPIDLNDPKSFTRVQQFLEIALPRETSDRLLQMWADAPDEGQRKTIWNMIGEQVLKSAGVSENDDLYKRFATDTAQGMSDRRYSVNGNDLVANGNGTFQPAGLLFKHANNMAYMPSFRDIYANAQRGRAMKIMYGLFNNPFMDWAMTNWKKFSLARPGFGVRITEEEVANAALRDGFINTVKAQIASRINAHTGEDVVDDLPYHDMNPIEHGISVLAREVGHDDLQDVETAQDVQHVAFAKRALQFLDNIGTKSSRKVSDLVDFQKEFPQLFDNPLAEEINAQHGMGRNYAGNLQDDIENIQDGMAKHVWNPIPKVTVKPTGKWIPYLNGSPGHTGMWMARLDDIAGDGATKPILQNIDLPGKELRRVVANHLLDPSHNQEWQRMTRGWKTADNRIINEHATKDDLALDWADHLITHVKAFVYSHDATGKPTAPIEGFVDHMLKTGASPDMSDLLKVATENRPPVTVGPEFADLPFGGVNGVLSEYADKLLSTMGGAVNAFSRHPQYLNSSYDAHKVLNLIVKEMLGDGPAAHELLQTLVHENAVRKVSQFVHRPEVRSQLNVIMTNLLPFQFAQEQFWKRWGKTFIHDPAAFRKAQLAHHALGASGVVHTDDQGNEIFTYPAAGFVQKELTNAFDAMHIPASLPIRQAFTGQLKMVAPGLDRSFAPSFGPLVSLPMNAITRMFPELQPVTTKVLGPIATGRPYWEQVVPASLSRFINALTASQNNSQAYANAMMKATQDLAATNHLPIGGFDQNGQPLPMTADERQKLMRRVSNWTRIQFVVRASLGLTAPASPELSIGDTKIGNEIRTLSNVKGLNLSEALQEVVHQNPDAYPYEVFLSQGAGSETLPATQEALESLNKNADFYAANKTAGGYFLPSTSSDDKFSSEAYKEQLAYGLREHRSVDQYVDQLEYAQAAGDYYDTKDEYTKNLKGLSGSAKQQLTASWDAWRTTYLDQHPVFADKLGSATAVIERSRTLTDLNKALDDPRAPKGEQTQQIQDLVDTYGAYMQSKAQYKGMQTNIANQAKKTLQTNFWTWATGDGTSENPGWIAKNPGALDVFNRLIRPEVEPTS